MATPLEWTDTLPPPGKPTSRQPRTATSPPADTKPSPAISSSAASTAIALTTPFRSSSTPRAGRGAARRRRSRCQHPRCRTGLRAASSAEQREVAVVPGGLDRCPERRVDAAGRAPPRPGARRRVTRAKSGDTTTTSCGWRLMRLSSLSGRKRLNACSHSSKSSRTAAASAAVAPPTRTRTPIASSSATLRTHGYGGRGARRLRHRAGLEVEAVVAERARDARRSTPTCSSSWRRSPDDAPSRVPRPQRMHARRDGERRLCVGGPPLRLLQPRDGAHRSIGAEPDERSLVPRSEVAESGLAQRSLANPAAHDSRRPRAAP